MKLKNKKNENENKESCENLCNLVVRKRKMLKDERGQLSIDFLVGISLFILALLFMAHFIPGMFVPFQSETVDLSSVAYRTSVILVEDPGCWDDGEDWENHIENVSRVGLAIDKEHPNMLKGSKIEDFNRRIDDDNLTDKLGLYRIIGDNPIDYGYNITIVNASGNITAARGEIPPEYGDVVKMKRVVSLHVSEYGGFDAANMSGASSPVKALLRIDSANVFRVCNSDVYIYITNISFVHPGPPGKFNGVKMVQSNITGDPWEKLTWTSKGLHIKDSVDKLNQPDDGTVQLNDSDTADLNSIMYIYSSEDTLKIIIHQEAFQRIGINTKDPPFGDVIIEVDLGNGILIDEVFDPGEISLYTTSEGIFQIPLHVIIQVWT